MNFPKKKKKKKRRYLDQQNFFSGLEPPCHIANITLNEFDEDSPLRLASSDGTGVHYSMLFGINPETPRRYSQKYPQIAADSLKTSARQIAAVSLKTRETEREREREKQKQHRSQKR